MKKIIYNLFCFSLIMLLCLNVFSNLNVSFLGFRVFKVGSGSMDPTLKVNDLILIKENNNYKKDDIVTFINNGEFVTHRIIAIDDGKITTKGDSNNTIDSPIDKSDIIGKMIYKFKLFGFISYLFAESYSWIILFILGLLITILIPDRKKKEVVDM